MGKIYTKKINGRKYKYERLSTKREGDKVVTKDKYLGPVHPVQGLINEMTPEQTHRVERAWKNNDDEEAVCVVVACTHREYARNTVIKWCRAKFGKRGIHV